MKKQNQSSKKQSLNVKTNVKGGFTPQPEPPGLSDLDLRNAGLGASAIDPALAQPLLGASVGTGR